MQKSSSGCVIFNIVRHLKAVFDNEILRKIVKIGLQFIKKATA